MSDCPVATFAYKWGASVAFDLVVEGGDPSNVSVSCDLKLPASGKYVPDHSDEAVVSDVASEFVAAVGDDKAYWRFSLTPEEVKALEPRLYITDAQIVFDDTGEVQYPDPLGVDFSKVVTVRPAT